MINVIVELLHLREKGLLLFLQIVLFLVMEDFLFLLLLQLYFIITLMELVDSAIDKFQLYFQKALN